MLIELLSGGFGAALVAGIFSAYQRRRDKKDASKKTTEDLKEAMRMQYYKSIKRSAKEYIARGYITTEELEDLTEEHRIYHDTLSGDGFLDHLMQHVHAIPVHD